MPTIPTPPPLTTDEKLDKIVHYLERMDRRERWRSAGGLVRGIIGILPTLVLLGTLWYAYTHGAELLKQIVSESAKQAAHYSTQGGSDFMQQMRGWMGGSDKK